MMLAFLVPFSRSRKPLARLLLLVAEQHDLIGRTIATLIHAVRGCICFQFVQFELVIIRQTANTKQPTQIRFHGVVRNNVGAIAVRVSAHDVPSVAFRTFHAAMESVGHAVQGSIIA